MMPMSLYVTWELVEKPLFVVEEVGVEVVPVMIGCCWDTWILPSLLCVVTMVGAERIRTLCFEPESVRAASNARGLTTPELTAQPEMAVEKFVIWVAPAALGPTVI